MVAFRSRSSSTFVLTILLSSLFLLLGLFAMPINAQTNSTWNGGTGNWSDTSNWNPGAVPNNGAGTTYNVTIDVPNSAVTIDILNVTIDNLTLGATDSLNINPSNPSNSLTLASGISSNAGNITNSGNLNIAGYSIFNNTGTIKVMFLGGASINNAGVNFDPSLARRRISLTRADQ
jgi:hypothetical protein